MTEQGKLKEKEMKKIRALVITVPLLLLMSEENARALPLSGMLSNRYESRPARGEPAPLAANKTDSAITPSKAVEKINAGMAHKDCHDRAHSRPKSKRYSDAARALAQDRLNTIKTVYTLWTRTHLVVTNGDRSEAQQASAIRGLIKRHGVKYVRGLYRNKLAINEILAAYLENRHHPQQAQYAMTKVISDQVVRGVYVSKHLRGLAVDIRSHGQGAARLSALRAAARKVGATVLVEPECYHLTLG